MPCPRAILFDLDGVLVRSEEPWFLTLAEAGRRFRGRPVTREEFSPTFGQGTAADIGAFGLGCSVEQLDRFYLEAFPRFSSTVWTNPEAGPLLERMSVRGIRRAVVTNTVSPLASQVLGAAGLIRHFEFLACADLVAQPKPAPDLALHALDRLGLVAQDAWLIGDSRYDRDAAHAAGIRFVGLGLDGDARIEHLGELARLLGV